MNQVRLTGPGPGRPESGSGITILQIGAGSIGWKVAGFHGSNEVMFHNGVDLTGEQAPP